MIKDDNVSDKYNQVWEKIKEKLNIQFHSMPVYDETYIKAKVREFNSVIKTKLLDGKGPKKNMHYTCIACISIDSVMGMEKKLSAGLFRRVQIQNKENTVIQIHKH